MFSVHKIATSGHLLGHGFYVLCPVIIIASVAHARTNTSAPTLNVRIKVFFCFREDRCKTVDGARRPRSSRAHNAITANARVLVPNRTDESIAFPPFLCDAGFFPFFSWYLQTCCNTDLRTCSYLLVYFKYI